MITWRYQQFTWTRNSENVPQAVEAYLVGTGPRSDQIITAGARVRWDNTMAEIQWSTDPSAQEAEFVTWLETTEQYQSQRNRIIQTIEG